jgi:hypothetical protein
MTSADEADAGVIAVSSGSRVRLSGRIGGDDGCTDAQTVKLKALAEEANCAGGW